MTIGAARYVMDPDFDSTLSDWHRAEDAASMAEQAVARLPHEADDAESRGLRMRAALLRAEADGLLAGLLRRAGSTLPRGRRDA